MRRDVRTASPLPPPSKADYSIYEVRERRLRNHVKGDPKKKKQKNNEVTRHKESLIQNAELSLIGTRPRRRRCTMAEKYAFKTYYLHGIRRGYVLCGKLL